MSNNAARILRDIENLLNESTESNRNDRAIVEGITNLLDEKNDKFKNLHCQWENANLIRKVEIIISLFDSLEEYHEEVEVELRDYQSREYEKELIESR